MGYHLLVALSGHGFGHLAQVAPVLSKLHDTVADLSLTIRTSLPLERLDSRLRMPFHYQWSEDDFGMLQHNALRVDVPATLERYRQYHHCWEERVAEVAEELCRLQPDLVFADVPYLTLAAAKRSRIPAVAMCNLNWLEILSPYCGDEPEFNLVLQQMRAAYDSADIFLRCTPAMPFHGLNNVQDIGLIASAVAPRRDQLEDACWVKPGERLVLIAMGGIGHRPPVERWPRFHGVRFAVPESWAVDREDCFAFEQSGIGFDEFLASCDAVITKPGYGTFSEAAVSGVPVIYVVREDGWPEQEYLIAWLQQHTHCDGVTVEALERGELGSVLEAAFAVGGYPPLRPEGVEQAAGILQRYLLQNVGNGVEQ